MLKLFSKITFAGLLLVLLFPACTEDDSLGGGTTRPPQVQGPSINLVADAGLVSSSADVPVNSTFTVRVSATAGEAALFSLTVQENGTNIPFDRMEVSDPNIGANPARIFNQTSITWDITIQTLGTPSNNTYSFIIVDENDLEQTATVNVNVEATPPTAIIAEQPPFLSGTPTVVPNSIFRILVQATQGTGLINSVTVLEDGLPIQDLTRLRIGDTDFPANPWTFNTGVESAEYEISIRFSDDGNDHTYDVVIGDENGQSSTASIMILAPRGTALSNTLTAQLLLNQAGPAGTGGINLFTGESLGSNDPNATIRDEGIDLDLPAASNWKRQISGINGSVIRTLADQPEGFSFDAIQFKEEIQNLFDTGRDLITENDAGRFVTIPVIAGDVFAIQNGADIFLVEVTSVVETESDNNDFYELSIKY